MICLEGRTRKQHLHREQFHDLFVKFHLNHFDIVYWLLIAEFFDWSNLSMNRRFLFPSDMPVSLMTSWQNKQIATINYEFSTLLELLIPILVIRIPRDRTSFLRDEFYEKNDGMKWNPHLLFYLPRISVSVFLRKSLTRLCNWDDARKQIFAQWLLKSVTERIRRLNQAKSWKNLLT